MSNWDTFRLEQSLTNSLTKAGFEQPTSIQSKVLPLAHSKADLVIQAKTGEGKTLCYVIPALNHIIKEYAKGTEKLPSAVLILVPTRELGMQVKQHIDALLTEDLPRITAANLLGGFAKPKQLSILSKRQPEILVATPGRLWELIEEGQTELINDLRSLRFLVIDEADKMISGNSFEELKKILEFIDQSTNTIKSTNYTQTKKTEILDSSFLTRNQEL